MTDLFREFLAGSRHLEYPAIALVLFFGVFVGVLWRLGRGWIRHQSYDREASLPLDASEKRRGRS